MKRYLLATLLCLVGPWGAIAADTDGDGLLDLLDVPGFNPDEWRDVSFSSSGIEDLDGANLLTRTRELILSENQITSIESGGFQGLENLYRLYIHANQITSIESGDFQGLDNLPWLNLNVNQITSIESGDFTGLGNLQSLLLGVNRITSIESGDFQGLENLQSLSLGGNQITSIERGDFEGLDNLQSLSLGGNQITSIESGAFQGLNNLLSLYLSDNEITQLNFSNATFDSLRLCGDTEETEPGSGFCISREGITSLILDDAVLSLGSFDSILSRTNRITDASLVGLTFSDSDDENPPDIGRLLRISTLNNVRVDESLFSRFAAQFGAFAAIPGNTVTVAAIPEPEGHVLLLVGLCGCLAFAWSGMHSS